MEDAQKLAICALYRWKMHQNSLYVHYVDGRCYAKSYNNNHRNSASHAHIHTYIHTYIQCASTTTPTIEREVQPISMLNIIPPSPLSGEGFGLPPELLKVRICLPCNLFTMYVSLSGHIHTYFAILYIHTCFAILYIHTCFAIWVHIYMFCYLVHTYMFRCLGTYIHVYYAI